MEAREEADPQPAADADFHPQGVGEGRLQPGLERVHIHEENQRDRRQEEKRKESPGREEGDFPFVGHPFPPSDAGVVAASDSDRGLLSAYCPFTFFRKISSNWSGVFFSRIELNWLR